MNINDSSLKFSNEEWQDNIHYKYGRNYVKELRVVKFIAERGVQLILEFNKFLTNDEVDKAISFASHRSK